MNQVRGAPPRARGSAARYYYYYYNNYYNYYNVVNGPVKVLS